MIIPSDAAREWTGFKDRARAIPLTGNQKYYRDGAIELGWVWFEIGSYEHGDTNFVDLLVERLLETEHCLNTWTTFASPPDFEWVAAFSKAEDAVLARLLIG